MQPTLNDLPAQLARHATVTATGCWQTKPPAGSNGYHRVTYLSQHWATHRLTYTLLIGPIPAGQTLDHLCHNADHSCPGGRTCPHRACVNPSHMEPVRAGENQRRGRGPANTKRRHAAVTHCPQGHPYTLENTLLWRSGKWTKRRCKTCESQRIARRRTTGRKVRPLPPHDPAQERLAL
jgi:hypothetical protein